MRSSGWSSDVCSSDLVEQGFGDGFDQFLRMIAGSEAGQARGGIGTPLVETGRGGLLERGELGVAEDRGPDLGDGHPQLCVAGAAGGGEQDRKSTRLNSSH